MLYYEGDNLLEKRGSGVLMHVSSLPSQYATGVFDDNCLYFADKLSEMGFSYWQVLPFNNIDASGSPYCSCSALAGNYLFIDPRSIYDAGLCSKEDYESCIYHGSPYTADFAFADEKILKLLRHSFLNVTPSLAQKIQHFCEENAWVTDYSLFMAVRENENGKPWWEWDKKYRDYNYFMNNHRFDFEEKSAFWKFVQYIFYSQWKRIREYVNQKGIKIIGDMPIYVARDSVDVWSDTDEFLLDKDTYIPEVIAGVPPDCFSEEGQLWGNPVYDWDKMKNSGYRFWLNRITSALKLYDIVRIDHFRGFASYYTVPFGSENAKNGKWVTGPGKVLFDVLMKNVPSYSIIAEDLGIYGEDVADLLEYTGFPGMKVIQFGFDEMGDSGHLPHNYKRNCVAYPGTHDNNTLLGWLWDAKEENRRFALDYTGFDKENWGDGGYSSPSCRKITECLFRSCADTVIVSFQDLCGFGKDARMNIPGVPELNWRFRTTTETINGIDTGYYKKLNTIYSRQEF